MKTIMTGRYDVSPNERIKMVFTPHNGAGEANVTAQSDGRNKQWVPGTTPSYSFDCRDDKGSFNSAKAECSFPGDISDDAFFEIEISGNPGEDVDKKKVSKNDANHEPEFRFKVV